MSSAHFFHYSGRKYCSGLHVSPSCSSVPPVFFYKDTATTEIYTLSLHDALPISSRSPARRSTLRSASRKDCAGARVPRVFEMKRSEEHTSELQSRGHLVCRLLLEKKKRPARS